MTCTYITNIKFFVSFAMFRWLRTTRYMCWVIISSTTIICYLISWNQKEVNMQQPLHVAISGDYKKSPLFICLFTCFWGIWGGGLTPYADYQGWWWDMLTVLLSMVLLNLLLSCTVWNLPRNRKNCLVAVCWYFCRLFWYSWYRKVGGGEGGRSTPMSFSHLQLMRANLKMAHLNRIREQWIMFIMFMFNIYLYIYLKASSTSHHITVARLQKCMTTTYQTANKKSTMQNVLFKNWQEDILIAFFTTCVLN